MWTRRRFLSTGLLSALGAGTALAFRDDGVRESMPDGSQAKGMVTRECQNAIDRGLRFLVSSQGQDGSWGEGTYANNVAVTSLGAMALMAAGNLPGRGPYGYNVKLALEFVMAQGQKGGGFARFGNLHPDGFLNNPNPGGGANPQGPMYSHGFGTLFLAEAYGMVPDRGLQETLRTAITKAVHIIIQSQNGDNGWRYQPTKQQGDLSVTICQIMALRSARNAGFLVPKSVVDACVRYVKASQNLDGSFRYMQNNAAFGFNGPAFARTAAGVCALYSAGIYQGKEIEDGLRYLSAAANRPVPFGRAPDPHYFYGHYYAVQAMWTAGGDYWSAWYPAIRDELIGRQNNGVGSWLDSVCSHYATAMACIILQVPNQYLPILQK